MACACCRSAYTQTTCIAKGVLIGSMSPDDLSFCEGEYLWEALQLETEIQRGQWICVRVPPLHMKWCGWDVPNHLPTNQQPCGTVRDVASLLASKIKHGTVCVCWGYGPSPGYGPPAPYGYGAPPGAPAASPWAAQPNPVRGLPTKPVRSAAACRRCEPLRHASRRPLRRRPEPPTALPALPTPQRHSNSSSSRSRPRAGEANPPLLPEQTVQSEYERLMSEVQLGARK